MVLSKGISAVTAPLTHHATQCWTVQLGDLSTVNIVVPSVDIRQCRAENRARKKSVYLSLVYNGRALRLVSGSDDGLAVQREGSNRH